MKLLLLLCWNAICLATPLVLFLMPAVEQSITRAVIIVFIAGPAALLALVGNLFFLFVVQRSVLATLLATATAALVLVWLVSVLIS